ncbi:hypothetical protein CRENBAI_001786 [Crenichthys baileyi]|uniref:Uncharacterized protein n=1 Tax=Crenichthys baileyi TaxID=28760 RepID=A0AAV9SMM3_9TELE
MGSRAHAVRGGEPDYFYSISLDLPDKLRLLPPQRGSGPTGGWPRVSRSGLARPGPARSNLATRRSPTSPDPRPGSRVGPRLRRTGRRHVPRYTCPHEGFLNRSMSDPSPRACLPWETLPGSFKPQTT